MSVDRASLSFGIKTSQSNLTYDEILRTWREADEVPVFEHAWLWDHMIPLRGDTNGAALEAWTLLAALAAQIRRTRRDDSVRAPGHRNRARAQRAGTPSGARA